MLGLRLFFIGIVATALAGGGFYVFKLQKDNAILKANAIKMESAISEQKELIENQKADFQEILNANKEMNAFPPAKCAIWGSAFQPAM